MINKIQFQRLINMGFVPGSENPENWSIRQLELTREKLLYLESKLEHRLSNTDHPDEALEDLFSIMDTYYSKFKQH